MASESIALVALLELGLGLGLGLVIARESMAEVALVELGSGLVGLGLGLGLVIASESKAEVAVPNEGQGGGAPVLLGLAAARLLLLRSAVRRRLLLPVRRVLVLVARGRVLVRAAALLTVGRALDALPPVLEPNLDRARGDVELGSERLAKYKAWVQQGAAGCSRYLTLLLAWKLARLKLLLPGWGGRDLRHGRTRWHPTPVLP
eukprot:scaffold28078_cov57-Phaeocystis_antarctica.AAC.10